MKNVFQAPDGKWFYKTYDERGSIIFNSFETGDVFDTQLEAYEASKERKEVDEVEEVKIKKVSKTKKN